MRILVPFAMLCFAALASANDDAVAEAGDAAEPVIEKPDKRSCRRLKVTGSNIKQRVCMTNRQWRNLERDAEERRRRAASAANNPENYVQ